MNVKDIKITLGEAQEMYKSDNYTLQQIALQAYSIADLNPDYKPTEEDKCKWNIKKDLPETWEGAVNILGTITRCGYIMSTRSLDKTSKEYTNWADHVWVPWEFADAYISLSNVLIMMKAWWEVDNDWEPGTSKTRVYYIKYTSGELYITDKPEEYGPIRFSSYELASKFLGLFRENLENCSIYL